MTNPPQAPTEELVIEANNLKRFLRRYTKHIAGMVEKQTSDYEVVIHEENLDLWMIELVKELHSLGYRSPSEIQALREQVDNLANYEARQAIERAAMERVFGLIDTRSFAENGVGLSLTREKLRTLNEDDYQALKSELLGGKK